MKPAIHNPDNLTPEQYGAADGWRLLYGCELNNLPLGAQVYKGRVWMTSLAVGRSGKASKLYAYRTRTPDPYADQPHDAVAEVIAKKEQLCAAIDAIVAEYVALAKGGAK